MFTNKKASVEWNLATIGGLIIAAMVGIVLLNLVDVYIHPEKLESTILAKNVALELEALHSSPYDVTYQHPVSLQTRSVIQKDNSIQVVAAKDAPQKKISRLTTFHEYYFYGSDDVVLPAETTLDAALVILTKQGSAVIVHDGSVSLAQVTSQATGLTNVKIAVTTVPGTSGDANILTNIAQALNQQLAALHIPTVPESQATIIVQLSFSPEQQHIIYYSDINPDAVRLLVANSRQVLDGLLQPIIGGQQTYSYSQGTMDISLGTSHANFATLQDSDTQRIIAGAIAAAIEQTYPQAQKTLNP